MDVATQPITTVASGRCTSAPTPVFTAMGTNPRLATRPVISTGRSRVRAACRMAAVSDMPCSSSPRKYDTNTMSPSTDTPDMATNPTPADTLNGMSRRWRAAMPPTAARGRVRKMRMQSVSRPYVA